MCVHCDVAAPEDLRDAMIYTIKFVLDTIEMEIGEGVKPSTLNLAATLACT